MSVVACKILENGFEMSSDSIVIYGSTQEKGERTHFAKLYEVNNIVVGSSGYAEDAGLLRLFLETHGIAAPDEKSILEFLAEFSEWKKTKTTNGNINDTEYLIGVQGFVFRVSYWHVDKVKTFAAIGAGMNFALAALYLGESTRKAVEVATELSIYCEKPIITIRKEIR